MTDSISRRNAVKQLGAAGAAVALGPHILRGARDGITIAGQMVEIEVASVSAVTARITIRPVRNGTPIPVTNSEELVDHSPGRIAARGTQVNHSSTFAPEIWW